MDIESKKRSRKWALVLGILTLATVGTFIPPIFSALLLGAKTPLVILSGGHFVTLVTLVVSAYFGANVFQKKVFMDQDKEVKEIIEIDPDEEGEA